MTNADQPAFPNEVTTSAYKEGLTKREYFAAMAMQGILMTEKTHTKEVPEFAIMLADELLRQLETTK